MDKTPELTGELIQGDELDAKLAADIRAARRNRIKAAFQPGIDEAIALLDKLVMDLKR